MKKHWKFIVGGLLFLALPLMAQNNEPELKDPHPGDVSGWTQQKSTSFGWGTIDKRYSRSQVPTFEKAPVLYAWRGERVAMQALLVAPESGEASITVSDLKSGKNIIPASAIKKYFVRYVITDNFARKDSFLMADRLDAAPTLKVEAQTTRPVWLDVRVPQDAEPGKYKGSVSVTFEGKTFTLPYTLQVSKRILPEPKDWAFHLDLWQNPYAVARYFNVPLWSKMHFDVMRPIMKNLADAGQKVITCSIIQHPWNSQTYDPFESMITKIKTLDGTWAYNYDVFDRWVEFMMSVGIIKQIDCYTLVPWHYRFDYFDLATNSVKYVTGKPGDKSYEDFLLPFLKDFAAHLKQKGWFERTCIAMDERPMEQMQATLTLVKKADPGYQIAGAFNYFPDVVSKVKDASVGYRFKLIDESVLQSRREKNQFVTFYTCCGPDAPNTFTFSPPAESAYMGWHSAAAGYNGYLRWAYNSWTVNPNQDTRFITWPSGDCFFAYPSGSSIRFERLVQGIQDYEKVRILKQTANAKQQTVLDNILQKFRPNNFKPGDPADTMIKEAETLLRSVE